MKKRCNVLTVIALSIIMVLSVSAVAFADQESSWKPSENQDKYEGIEYGLGMFSAAAKGTDITVNNDGTVTLAVTTKPMVSTKYTKVAFSQEQLSDTDKMEQAASEISVEIGTAEDVYLNPFSGANEGIKSFYWSIFTYTMPVEALKDPVYCAGFNKLVKNSSGVYEEGDGMWAYSSTWTFNPTKELITKLRIKQAEISDKEIAERIGLIAAYFEGNLLETVKEYIAAAKADLTNKNLIEKALKAYESLSDEQKAEVESDIKVLKDAKAAIEKKEKEKAEAEARKKAEQVAIAKVKATKITGLKVKATKKKMTVSWTKNTKVFAGYQVQYKIKGGKAKTVKITKASTAKKVIKKLKRKKKYTVKVRGYKKIAGAVRYGKWSSSKTVKIK